MLHRASALSFIVQSYIVLLASFVRKRKKIPNFSLDKITCILKYDLIVCYFSLNMQKITNYNFANFNQINKSLVHLHVKVYDKKYLNL